MKKYTRCFSYHRDMPKSCPEMAPYMDYLATPSGKLSVMVVTAAIRRVMAGGESIDVLAESILFVSLMSALPVDVLEAYARSVAMMNGGALPQTIVPKGHAGFYNYGLARAGGKP